MKKIEGYFHISNTEFEKFNDDLKQSINNLQNDGQEVEVQYKTNTLDNGQLVFSALILGRVEV
ncbi:hypothetical protein [Clostridium beijerinckii]|uniref:hypothetical protein n=1 Tax=Clostridium beijerinckii TaxID=1520 RepID=UPI00156F5193|nr:hypothetical protein [Clostridium beijerinckii]NRU52641.1 hypothetical protein [Clostridium beijerinckii]NYC68684.1 hypothetical protein [Clostridium beijerinckii]NYC91833.1 hypothetical protein [Clostridium beijerinckii]